METFSIVSEVCNAMCEEYVDEVMTAPSHLKNGNYFLNFLATIDT